VALEYEARSWFDNLFWSARPLFSLSGRIWNPPVDVSDGPDHVFVRMEIAGVQPENLSVVVDKNHLIIRGYRGDRTPTEGEEPQIIEIRHGRFERVIHLPSNIFEDGIHASYREGFLDIWVPKGEAQGKSFRIPIREG